MKRVLKHGVGSYAGIFTVGLLVGVLCRLLDLCPADTLWSFSSPQTLFGFWIITNTVIVLMSTSHICAGLSSCLYMFGMAVSFYGAQPLLGAFFPAFDNGFKTSLFVLYAALSIPCGVAAFILYDWNRDHVFNSVLYALPIGALASEAVAVAIYFWTHHTFLFQLSMDLVGVLVFFRLFLPRAKSKRLYVAACLVSTLVFYWIFPW